MKSSCIIMPDCTPESTHKGGNYNNGVACCSSSSLQAQFSKLQLPTSWPPEGYAPRILFCGCRAEIWHAIRTPRFQQRVSQDWHKASHTKVRGSVDNEGFLEK
jgi:hypothetical protein